MHLFDGSVPPGTLALLFVCLTIALGFEFVNGFHDTANAVATVIYTKSLKPTWAVILSGALNLLGVLTGGVGVAFGIVHLLPVELLIKISSTAGILMVLSLLLSAIIWNFSTWYFGLPSSSSHALIGSIVGVGLASSIFNGEGFGSGVNWAKVQETITALLVSPIVGFFLAGLLLLIFKAVIRDPRLYSEPHGDTPPPAWIRGLLILTCSGVSYAHGSNDGQKGIGLIMLILIGLVPSQFALNTNYNKQKIDETVAAIQKLDGYVARDPSTTELRDQFLRVKNDLNGRESLATVPADDRVTLRTDLMTSIDALKKFKKKNDSKLSKDESKDFDKDLDTLSQSVDFVENWVPFAVAIALGVGTTIGWKRIVVTVGEKIGKTHLTYGQGAAAELVAMTMIYAADRFHLPVSTTHILSSGVAGTMAANKSGIQVSTIRNIALAWVLTLPVTILLSGTLYALSAGSILHKTPPPKAPVYQVPDMRSQ